MNEFSKDELIKIILWGNLYQSGAGLAWPKIESKKEAKAFLKKIQSMIDNYCEHENSWVDFYCEDCKKEMRWEMSYNARNNTI